MIGFIYALRDAGVPVSVQYVIEFYRALRRGMATDLDRLFLLARLVFVKKVEYYDAFEQAFAAFFLGGDMRAPFDDLEDLVAGKPFREWLREQAESGGLTPEEIHRLGSEELLARFWETVLAQKGRHQGGNRWVGTRGKSPFGHNGASAGGIRVYGEGLYGTAQKVIGNRRFLNYNEKSALAAENLGQALTALKSLRPCGPESDLDVDETIARTARNGGEIELVFRRELRDRLRLVVLLDNGGYSMWPHLELVKTVFNKIRGVVRDVDFYYFHNCVYGTVYKDPRRTRPVEWEKFLGENRSTRLILIGDANMAPAELMASYGSLDLNNSERKPGREWLMELRAAFPASVWLNPLPQEQWLRESPTVRQIGSIFQMEGLNLAGIKNAVAYLNMRGKDFDGR